MTAECQLTQYDCDTYRIQIPFYSSLQEQITLRNVNVCDLKIMHWPTYVYKHDRLVSQQGNGFYHFVTCELIKFEYSRPKINNLCRIYTASNIKRTHRPDISRRRLPPCPLVIALVHLNCSSKNLQFS